MEHCTNTGTTTALALANLASVRPGLEVIELSSRTGKGMDLWLQRLDPTILILHAELAGGRPT